MGFSTDIASSFDEDIVLRILDDIVPVIELGDQIKLAAKRMRRGEISYNLDDFDVVSFGIMCDFATSLLGELAPALEDGLDW